jgi:hypothetical protein
MRAMPCAGAGVGIELRDPFDEVAAVGEIEIVDAERDRGLHHPVRVRPIGLEWPACIHHDVGSDLAQLRLDLAVPIEGERDGGGLRPQARAERRCARRRAAADDQGQAILVRQQLREPAPEGPITAEDENLQPRCGHRKNRSA